MTITPAPHSDTISRLMRAVPEQTISSFRDLVADLQPSADRILDVGAGGFVGATTTVHLLDLFPDAHITAVERHPARANALREEFGDRIEVVTGDVLEFRPDEPYDLTAVDIDPVALPVVFETMLNGVLADMTVSGGLLVVDVLMNLHAAYHGENPSLAHGNEEAMRDFMRRHFGAERLTEQSVAAMFATSPLWSPVALVEKWRDQPERNFMGWLALRRF